MRYLRSVAADPDKEKVPDHALAELAHCAQRIRDLEAFLAHATTFTFPSIEGINFDSNLVDDQPVTADYVGRGRWGVRRMGRVWNHVDRAWEYEPQPSSRDDAFRARCYFRTRDQAVGVAMELTGG